MQIVWFKKDLRVYDHAPLYTASQQGPVLPLYILEPELWQQPDMSYRHYCFLQACLQDLHKALLALTPTGLVIQRGNAVAVLAKLNQIYALTAVHSHEETGNGWTYNRDKAVSAWLVKNHIKWHEYSQNGVVRRLQTRTGWSKTWYTRMTEACSPEPRAVQPVRLGRLFEPLPDPAALGLYPDGIQAIQPGGRQAGLATLADFLAHRSPGYAKGMSSPVTAYTSCSRLSVHMAFGTLSIREIFQAAQSHPKVPRAFLSRLRWHCHFIQKLEDEPRIEFENLHPAYNAMRQTLHRPYFDAWRTGQTGFPLVDACMRSLIATGWLNFRMRAMLMSVASYHLWLPWREPALHLARLFTDYEPGIHYSQVQMQSGTTGINTLRIYSPTKQALDQDPDGVFRNQWLPADYELDPIVDEKIARKQAADKLYTLKRTAAHKLASRTIVTKHASRA